ncbi:hypothetical protein KRM28CT15_46470 [Krasilnikovia sp. M28-CT-15]
MKGCPANGTTIAAAVISAPVHTHSSGRTEASSGRRAAVRGCTAINPQTVTDALVKGYPEASSD